MSLHLELKCSRITYIHRYSTYIYIYVCVCMYVDQQNFHGLPSFTRRDGKKANNWQFSFGARSLLSFAPINVNSMAFLWSEIMIGCYEREVSLDKYITFINKTFRSILFMRKVILLDVCIVCYFFVRGCLRS